MLIFRPLMTPLFVPATRPERIAKATESGADSIIVDLEDAVPPAYKSAAHDGLADWLVDVPVPVFVRINPVGSDWFEDDLCFITTQMLQVSCCQKHNQRRMSLLRYRS